MILFPFLVTHYVSGNLSRKWVTQIEWDWGFHGGDDNNDVLLGLGVVRTGWWKPMFRRSVLSPSSGLKWRCWESEGARLSLYLTQSWLALSFRRHFLAPYIIPLIPNIVTSVLKIETVRFSETLASTRESARRLNPEHHHHSNCVP
jgi:hypothetical protein